MDLKTIPILEKIKKARESKGLSQAEVASHLGISQNSYKEIEKGNTSLKVQVLLDLCDILGLSSQEILDDNKKGKQESVLLTVDSNNITNFLNSVVKNQGEMKDEVKELRKNQDDVTQKLDELLDLFGKKKKK